MAVDNISSGLVFRNEQTSQGSVRASRMMIAA